MMAGYDNTNSGIISKNSRKEQDTHADIRGSINIEGTEYWLDGWLKERKDGSGRFYSLRAKRKDGQQKSYTNQSDGIAGSHGGYGAASGGSGSGGGFGGDDEDSIPFEMSWK